MPERVDDDLEPISTGAVARLGYLRASRSLCVYFWDESDIDELDLEMKIGIVESMHPFGRSNVRAGSKSLFLARKRVGRILGLQSEVAISPHLREYVESLSSALFQARARHFAFIKFVSASDAQHFLDNFPAATLGATMNLVKTKPLHHCERFAIQSGAGRALTMSLPRAMSLSVEELTRDFSQFRGLLHVTMSTDHEVILRYNSVQAALKTVCALETRSYNLPDKYVGARVSFLPMRDDDMPETDPPSNDPSP
ncbi:hypothetical protein BDZ89DRAFT_1064832 [Hymenopellis radicata]|nr:hypothetical protein BDZ89DRAFT_1064832 [Hymenopellis radicata]